MRYRWLAILLMIGVVLGATAVPGLTRAATVTPTANPPSCVTPDTTLSGATVRMCFPDPAAGDLPWNGSAVVWAHGYIPPIGSFPPVPPPDFQATLPDGTDLFDLIPSLGFAFIATTYRSNGLVVQDGVTDIGNAINSYSALFNGTPPGPIFLVGASEGGLITTLVAEQQDTPVDGALAACGITGSFLGQVNYMGDFLVLFDYFFPNVSPIDHSQSTGKIVIKESLQSQAGWLTYAAQVAQTLALPANASARAQLIATAKIPIDMTGATSPVKTIGELLYYSVFITNDATTQLGGNPFDNAKRWYWGSRNDLKLNLKVLRFRASPTALANSKPYETTGSPKVPLVMPHTTGDNVVPFWHELLYVGKAALAGSKLVTPLPVLRYGHCQFTKEELVASFGLLVYQVTGQTLPSNAPQPSTFSADFAALQQAYAAQEARETEIQTLFANGPQKVNLPLLAQP